MPITYDCPECGRKVQAPEELAGKKARCPFCQGIVMVPQAQALEAEEVPFRQPDSGYPGRGEPSRPRMPPGLEGMPPRRREPDEHLIEQEEEERERHRPCPMCGEMIIADAAKCRFCGEIFDASLLPRSGSSRGTSRGNEILLRAFNGQMAGLGALWIVFGGLGMLAVLALSGAPRGALPEELLGLVFLVVLCWLLFGIFTCAKQMWAVYCGLVLSYISVLGNIVNLAGAGALGAAAGPQMCGIIFAMSLLIGGIVQAHRLIGMSGQLSRRR